MEYLQTEPDRQIPSGRIVVDALGIMAMITQPMEVKVFSNNLDDPNAAADQIAQAMREMEGTVCVNNSSDLSVYGYYVETSCGNDLDCGDAAVSGVCRRGGG